MSNAVNKGSFLLNSNWAHGGVQNKDSGRSTIAKIDVIEGAEAYLYIHESISLQACQLDSLLAKLNRRDRPDQCQKNRPDPAAVTVKGRPLLLQLKVATDVDVDMPMLKSSKRNRKVSHARAVISYLAVNELGCRASEVARKLRISGMAVGKCVERGKKLLDKS